MPQYFEQHCAWDVQATDSALQVSATGARVVGGSVVGRRVVGGSVAGRRVGGGVTRGDVGGRVGGRGWVQFTRLLPLLKERHWHLS